MSSDPRDTSRVDADFSTDTSANLRKSRGRPRKPEAPWEARAPEDPDQLLTLAEAKRKYKLDHFHVYAAVRRGEVLALSRGEGRTYYPESQLRQLAASIGLYSECSAA